jgi:hypothetical protein
MCCPRSSHPGDQLQLTLSKWVDLSNMYAALGDFTNAAFCMEEVLLAAPQDAAVMCRLAELLCSAAATSSSTPDMRVASLRNARKYFSHALVLKPDGNIRALHGLAAVRRDPLRTPLL